ncbi:MAG: TfuA-like protein, partial [Mycobacteriales bacterium]
MQIAPIVYLGPSLPGSDAEIALPGCDLRAPIRRGDLYRDRLGGGSVFVIIDGVFHQEPAVSPREILDVLEDGAVIVGASSMGALRAAECWPAGMRGVGTIYRLYRRGALLSDDEVILVYSSEGSGYQPRSVPLINVRYALSRALRKGLLERPAAERIVASAQRLHFSERCWPVILANAGALDPHGELQTLVSSLDLKREDTVRCLHTVARWLAETPALAERPRRLSTAFIPSEARRQRDYDALAGLDREEVKRDLSRWQLISGRYSRHLLRIAAVDPEIGLAARLKRKGALAPL